MVKIASLVTVRNSSSRLPEKAVKTVFENLRTIEIVLSRAKKTGYKVIICTSTDESDNVFESIAMENKVDVSFHDMETVDGMAEGAYHDVLQIPTTIIEKNETMVERWDGEVPYTDALKNHLVK